MFISFNPNCIHCPVANECFEDTAAAANAAASAESLVETSLEAFRHEQVSFRFVQHLEATGLPGEIGREKDLVRDVTGITLPTNTSLINRFEQIGHYKDQAKKRSAEKVKAEKAYDSLVDGCEGPRTRRIAGLAIGRCQGNDVSFVESIIVSRAVLL